MRVLGIDPGLSITGYGLVESGKPKPILIEAGCIRNNPHKPIEYRLHELYKGIQEILFAGQPDCISIEALFSHYGHPTAAIQMGHARGVLLLAAVEKSLPVFTYAPARVKKAIVGTGRATKLQVQNMIKGIFDLAEVPSPPDVADALAIALCHLSSLGSPTVTIHGRGRKKLPDTLQNLIGSGKRLKKHSGVDVEALLKASRGSS